MKRSAKENILAFLQQNQNWFHNGDLQRMDFYNRNGSRATGDTIKRRLQNLAEEGKIFVELRKGEAWYSAEYKPKMVQNVTYKFDNEGRRVAVIDLIPA